MVPLDTRCRDILILLLESSAPLASKQIAGQLDITPRMVRYSLGKIEKWLQENSARLTKAPGRGILIDASERVRRDLIRQLENPTAYPPLLSPTERFQILTLSLLSSGQPLLVKQIKRDLNVSRTTVLKDLDVVGGWLEGYHLHLIRRPNFGCQVVGEEGDRQKAIVDFLLENVGESRLLALYGGPTTAARLSRKGDVGFRRAQRTFLESLETSYSRQLVSLAGSTLGIRLVDSTYVALILHIAVLIKRVQEGNRIDDTPEYLAELKERPEFSIARIISENVEQRFGFSLTEPEIAHVTAQLLGSEVWTPTTDLIGTQSTSDEIAPEVLEIVDGILARASPYLHPSLRVDQVLIRNLSAHLTLALDRLRFGLPMRNPLLEDVKKRYPHTFKVTRESSVILEDRLGKRLPEAEIGYIAMYLVAAMERLRLPTTSRCRILVACGAGVATTWLLVSRIRAELPEVEIVEVTSARELQSRKSFAGIDVVVCTTPVEVESVPAVVVSPFLSSQDMVKLKSALQTKDGFSILRKQAEHAELNDLSLADLITAETTSLEVYVNSWQAAVDKAGALLLYAGAIEPRYIEAMKDMIRQHGPYMVAWPGVALLHARPEDGVRRLCMSLVVLRQPVNFGHPENDPVFLAIALGAVDNRSHLRALLELHEVLLDRGTVDEIRTAVHKSKVLHLISSFSG